MSAIRCLKDLPYATANGRVVRLDLFIPDHVPAPRPTILWVRGGGWRSGDKNVENPCEFLAQHGFVAANIEYRGSPEIIAPGNVHDCKAAVRWLRANAGAYGIDPQRIGVYGGSAGGHLVALLATTTGVAELEGDRGHAGVSSQVQAACDYCGPSDLTRIALPAIRQQFPLLYDVTAEYLGGPVDERRELARLVSPLRWVSRTAAPLLIVHGDADSVVPVEESHIFHEALKAAGAVVDLHIVQGGDHSWDQTLTDDRMIAFFRQALARR